MAPVQPTEDFYAVLEIDLNADTMLIKSSYRRLAKIKHPDKAQDKLKATADFQLLQQAYSTLIDPEQRKLYDRTYISIQSTRHPKQAAPQTSTKVPPSQDSRHSTSEHKTSAQEIRLRNLRSNLASQRDAFTAESAKTGRLRAELETLEAQKLKAQAQQASSEQTGWFSYFSSFVYEPRAETAEEKLEKHRVQLARNNAIRIKQHRLDQHLKSVRAMEDKLTNLEEQVNKVQQEIRLAEMRQKTEKEEQERRRRAAAYEEFRANVAKEQARQEADLAARLEKQRRDQAAAAAEAKRKAEEEDRKRRAEARERHQAKQAAEEQAQRDRDTAAQSERQFRQQVPKTRSKLASDIPRHHYPFQGNDTWHRRQSFEQSNIYCKHHAFWTRIEGRQTCSHCKVMTWKFAFQCPGCDIVACAACRQILKGGRN